MCSDHTISKLWTSYKQAMNKLRHDPVARLNCEPECKWMCHGQHEEPTKSTPPAMLSMRICQSHRNLDVLPGCSSRSAYARLQSIADLPNLGFRNRGLQADAAETHPFPRVPVGCQRRSCQHRIQRLVKECCEVSWILRFSSQGEVHPHVMLWRKRHVCKFHQAEVAQT